MDISVDVRDLEAVRALWMTAGKNTKPAMTSTLNWVGDRANTQVKRTLAKQMGAPYGSIGDAIKITRASYSHLEYDIDGHGKPIPLIAFDARQVRGGVSARPWGLRRVFAHAFIARSSSGEDEVFVREGKTRLPIRKLWGPSVPREMTRDAVPEAFKAVAETQFAPRLSHEIARLFNRG